MLAVQLPACKKTSSWFLKFRTLRLVNLNIVFGLSKFRKVSICEETSCGFSKFRKVSICEETSCGTIFKMPGFLPFVKMYEKPMVAMIVCNFDNFGHLENVILIFKVSQVLACQFDPPF